MRLYALGFMYLALCTWLEGRFCRSTVEIRSHIASGFGLDYSHSGCIKLLARLGFEYRKPRPLPKLASAEQQTKPAFGRVRKGSNPAVKTTAGRGRVNIHGALNLETFNAPFVEPTTVDGVSAAQLLSGTGARNPDKRIIHVFWHVIWHVIIHVIRDNAACPKGPDVRAFLARSDCRIHLVQLPPYCPHINPIERLSALIHQHVTHNRHDPTKKQFVNAILGFLRETIPNEWKTFPSQVSDNFRVTTVTTHEKFRVFG